MTESPPRGAARRASSRRPASSLVAWVSGTRLLAPLLVVTPTFFLVKRSFEAARELTRIGGALNATSERLQATIEEREAALGEKVALARAMLEEREKNEQELRRRRQVIEQQREAIRAMSTPIIQAWDHVLALPVVGRLDSARAEAIVQTLLDAISERQARFAILDLTGVTAADATTAALVIEVVRAVNLLGARGIVTGLRSEFATQMVSLGVDLSGLTPLGTLREALRACLRPGAAQAR